MDTQIPIHSQSLNQTPAPEAANAATLAALAQQIRTWGRELGFSGVGIAGLELAGASERLQQWLDQGFHGEMDYMARHRDLRAEPAQLVPGALRAISVRMDYLPQAAGADWAEQSWQALTNPGAAVVARYAHGRDYHKVLRARLQQLAVRIGAAIGPFGYRVFTDSAPVMEVELAQQAGLGWRGKHTLLLSREAGSMFFLGEILLDVPLPVDVPVSTHCGQCSRCMDVCPTQAIIGPYQLDARRCISYLTIELKGSIPEELRPLIGNRIYGCDDCQLACPWNKYAQRATVPDFDVRAAGKESMDALSLLTALSWDEDQFLALMAGSAIRRIGHERWLRNVAVAVGNALAGQKLAPTLRQAILVALARRAEHPSALVREHVLWALHQADRQTGMHADANAPAAARLES